MYKILPSPRQTDGEILSKSIIQDRIVDYTSSINCAALVFREQSQENEQILWTQSPTGSGWHIWAKIFILWDTYTVRNYELFKMLKLVQMRSDGIESANCNAFGGTKKS